MILGLLQEPLHENRVSLLPEALGSLLKKKIEIWVEPGAGRRAYASDEAYLKAGAQLHDRAELLAGADVLLGIHAPSAEEWAASRKQAVWLGVYAPLYHPELLELLTRQGLTVFSLDMVPRSTRAQSMDVLSSQANIAGYQAVLLAAKSYPRYFPMLMTAAGSIPPAKLLVLGAGVAGLQAIATGRRLGAVVEVFDTRPAVKEEVMSLGARFIEVEGAADPSSAGGYAVEQSEDFQRRQKQRIADSIAKSDIVITTAQIPGKRAPVLVTRDMIATMRSGSVIVDLAASSGGNTELTEDGTCVEFQGIRIIGNSNLPGEMPADASKLYGRNLLNFLQLLLTEEGTLKLNFEDDLVAGTCLSHAGTIVQPRVRSFFNLPEPALADS